MSPDSQEKVIFLVAGWLLSVFSTILALWLKDIWERRKQIRKLLNRVHLILEGIFLESELAPELREAGIKETVTGLLGFDESFRKRIPPTPPRIPTDYDSVLEQIVEWESVIGQGKITRKLIGLRGTLELLHNVHAGLYVYAEEGKEIPEQALSFYNKFQPTLKESINEISRLIFPMRLTRFQRMKRKVRRALRRKPPPNNSFNPTPR
jgi:hypothetical protein